MAIILPNGLTSSEIRVLQEFRRTNSETMTIDQIKAIKHPTGGGEAPAISLVSKGFLEAANGGADAFRITQKAVDFLAIEAMPLVAETSDAAASAAENPEADGV